MDTKHRAWGKTALKLGEKDPISLWENLQVPGRFFVSSVDGNWCLQPKLGLGALPGAGETQEFGLCRRRDVCGAWPGKRECCDEEQLQKHPCRALGVDRSSDKATRGWCWGQSLQSEAQAPGWHSLLTSPTSEVLDFAHPS